MDKRLSSVEQRLTSVETRLSYLCERQSMSSIIKLLNEFYFINIRRLDTGILLSLESADMCLFFHFVGNRMKHDYHYLWGSIKTWLGLSVSP